tara:strand:- start:1592 stop:1735 length:144 start_codon:yes stop_codon:yes gene_type:complete
MLLYIGPGVGVATIVIVGIVLLIVLASILVVLWRPIKRMISRFKGDK